jgi:hypothetical protein
MDIRVACVAATLLAISACTPAGRSWKLEAGRMGVVLVPPAIRSAMNVPLCKEKVKLSPAQVLMRRTEIIHAEDEGCMPHGRSGRILEEAVQHQVITPAAIPHVRYGYALPAGFADVAPGWRLRVVTLLTKSGRFRMNESAEQSGPNTLTIRTDSDFLGHETAYYSVSERPREPGVALRLETVRAAIGDQTESRTEPKVALFQLPDWARHVRLVFLTRASSADHDMAILAARSYWDLEQATTPVQVTPKTGCATTKTVYCAWVPAGIAVTPEIRVLLNGVKTWVALPATVGSVVSDRKAVSLTVRRRWRGKMLPVAASNLDVRQLPLIGDEEIEVARP